MLYGQASQGATRIVFGRRAGATTSWRCATGSRRRSSAAGYALDGTDQEAVEAEAHFSRAARGQRPGEAAVRGVLEVRYRLSG